MTETLRVAVDGQRRRRTIAMTVDEVEEFLLDVRNCYLATSTREGVPHVTPTWFVWHDGAIWISSLVRSQRWVDICANPRVSAVFDAGQRYDELRGVRIDGNARSVGDIPRTAGADPRVSEPEQKLAEKYWGTREHSPDGRHAWLRIEPVKISSWDFRKIAGARQAKVPIQLEDERPAQG